MSEPQTLGVLLGCADPLLALAAGLEKEAAGLSAEQLLARCEGMLCEFENDARAAQIPLALVDAAKYAIVALIDERIFLSELPCKDNWINQPLQLRLFGDFAAGEEFYTRLDTLLRDNQALPALEVFQSCLALGFAGKHADRAGAERRKVLMDQIVTEVLRNRNDVATLSPRSSAPHAEGALGGRKPSFLAGLPLWSYPLIVCALVLLVILICQMLLNGSISDAQERAEDILQAAT